MNNIEKVTKSLLNKTNSNSLVLNHIKSGAQIKVWNVHQDKQVVNVITNISNRKITINIS